MKPFIASELTNGEKTILNPGRILPPPIDPEQSAECLLKIREIFNRHSIPFWLVGGTLLGAIRDGGFIPWDKDIDLAMYDRDAPLLMPAIREMEEFGLKVVRTNNIDNTFQVKRNMICIAFANNRRYRERMWRWWRFYEPFDAYSELIPYQFLGEEFLIPSKYEQYLEIHYGLWGDWRVPNRKCKHAKLFRIPRKDL